MKTREEVIALFRAKYDDLQTVCQQQIGPFNESAIYQNPDGGWQLNLEQPGTDYKAAITLRPNDEVPHETHGVIGARWFQEGGAFDAHGNPGLLGYPVADEVSKVISVTTGSQGDLLGFTPPPSVSINVSGAVSEFEFGTIQWRDSIPFEVYLRGVSPCHQHDETLVGNWVLNITGLDSELNISVSPDRRNHFS